MKKLKNQEPYSNIKVTIPLSTDAYCRPSTGLNTLIHYLI